MEISYSLLSFQAYLYFVSHFQLWVMLLLWLELFKALERYMVGFEADECVFTPSTALKEFTASMKWGLAISVILYLWLSIVFQDFALAPQILAVIPMVGYPVLLMVLMGWHELWGSFWKITWDALSIWKQGGLTFKDGFVADMPTSLTKAVSDYTYSWFRWLSGDQDVISKNCKGLLVDPTMCGNHYIATSLAMSFPYLIRLYQCLGGAWYADSKWEHLLNAAKYASSILVLILSRLQSAGIISYTWYYVAFACAISLFVTLWDILGDWQLQSDSRNQHIVQHTRALYIWICLSDSILRFSWLYTWVVHPPYSSLVTLLVAILEILRRYQWAYFCVERGAKGFYHLLSPEVEESRDTLRCVRIMFVDD